MRESGMTIEKLLESISDLPTLPASTLRVIKETDNSTSSAASVALILGQDQALGVKVLRLANSAYYGLSRKVSTLGEAVVILGMRTVRNLALVASSYPWMSKPIKGYELGPRALWCHSFGVSTGAQLIAKQAKLGAPEEAFTAGLMCDIGKVAMSVQIDSALPMIVNAAQQFCLPFDLAERELFGFDHAEVGEHMAIQWNFPKVISDAIRYHHAPRKCEGPNHLVDCVHIGDYLTSSMGFGIGGDGLQYIFDDTALERLGIKADDLDQVINDFVISYEEYERSFQELQSA